MKAKYLSGIFIVVFITEVLLCVIPFIHVYVHGKYYVTYSLTISGDESGHDILYSHYEGLNNSLTWRKPPEEIFSLDSLLNISMLKQPNLITIESIRYPGCVLAHESYLSVEVLEKYPEMLIYGMEDRNNYPREDGDYLVLARLDNDILTMLAHVNYGGKSYDVFFDTPNSLPSNPECMVSDVVLSCGVYVEPNWLITLKVISWVLYPAMLVPATILTWLALGRRRRELGAVLITTLFVMSFAYVYSVITGNPKGLMDYLMHNTHGLRIVNKSSITVLGIRKAIKINMSKGEETINLSELITPYEARALEIVMNYLNTHKLVIAVPQDPSVRITVVGARKLSDNIYVINFPYGLMNLKELSNVKLTVKPQARGEGVLVTFIYVGFPRSVRLCLED